MFHGHVLTQVCNEEHLWLGIVLATATELSQMFLSRLQVAAEQCLNGLKKHSKSRYILCITLEIVNVLVNKYINKLFFIHWMNELHFYLKKNKNKI